MSASLILSGMSSSASWVLLTYHLISPKGNRRTELSLCSGSALCVQPSGNVYLCGCKGIAIPVFPEFTAQQYWHSRKNKAVLCSCPPSTNGIWYSSPFCFWLMCLPTHKFFKFLFFPLFVLFPCHLYTAFCV